MVSMSNVGGAPSIQECLVGVTAPVMKDDPIERLRMSGTTTPQIDAIRSAPATRFTGPQEVSDAVRGG